MIYDVRSEFFQTFLSAKQGAAIVKDKKGSASVASKATNGDAMDTD